MAKALVELPRVTPEDAHALQTALVRLGEPVTVDSDFGAQTAGATLRAAVRLIQAARVLEGSKP